jgi:copper chaperone CopZ
MKTINKLSTLLIVLFSFTFFNAIATEKVASKSETIYMKIYVDGMACPFCAYGLEKQIKKTIKAKEFNVSINEGFITIAVPKDKKPSEEELKELIKDAGFKMGKIEYSEVPFKTKKDEK